MEKVTKMEIIERALRNIYDACNAIEAISYCKKMEWEYEDDDDAYDEAEWLEDIYDELFELTNKIEEKYEI